MNLDICLKDSIKTSKRKVNYIDFVTVFPCDENMRIFLSETTVNINSNILAVKVFDVIKEIRKNFPDTTVNNVGSDKTIIIFESPQKKSFAKIFISVFILLIAFFGGATSIVNFHSDIDIQRSFDVWNSFFAGKSAGPLETALPYAAGVAVGFLFIINIFRKKGSPKPSLIELDMDEYAERIQDYMSRKNKK
jgi:stage V sporulation protein AA